MKIKKTNNQHSKQAKNTNHITNDLRAKPQTLEAGYYFGVAIDRRRRIEFFLDEKKYHAFEGDHLASALLANNQKFLAGSLIYHRPRGMMIDHFYESNGFVAFGKQAYHGFEPSIAVANLPLVNGMKLSRTRHPDKFSTVQFLNKTREAINALPANIFDPSHLSKKIGDQSSQNAKDHRSLGLMNSFSGKNFSTTSGGFWAGFLRQMVGYAPAPMVNPAFQSFQKDPLKTVLNDKMHHRYDLIIIGGGGAAAAALQSFLASIGKQKISIALLSNEAETITINHMTAIAKKSINAMRRDTRIKWFFHTTATNAKRLTNPIMKKNNEDIIEIIAVSHHKTNQTDPHSFVWHERQNIFHTRAVILATGKSEQLLPFDNNDIPGVMGFNNAINLLTTHGVKPGHHAVIITNNNSVYHHLHYLQTAGVDISAVVDIRKNIHPDMHHLANQSGVSIYEFYYPKKARALYTQSAPTLFPNSIGKLAKILGRIVRTDNPSVASLLAVKQLAEHSSTTENTITSDNHPTSLKKPLPNKKKSNQIIDNSEPPANKIILARPDQTDEALSAETERIFNSDCLLVSGGFQPRLSLFTQLLPKNKTEGDYLIWSETLQAYVPNYWPPQVFLIGAIGGCLPSDQQPHHPQLMDMARSVAKNLRDFFGEKKSATDLATQPRHHHHHGFSIMPHRYLPDISHLGRNSFLDYQYDVKLEHLYGAFHSGYQTPFGLKHYSKLGFGFNRGLGSLSLGLAYIYGNQSSLNPNKIKINSSPAMMEAMIKENNIFDELHANSHPTALDTIAALPLDGQRFFNQSTIKEEMPLYPLTHRPKFFQIAFHPENNIGNDHGAHCLLQDEKKIPHYYPYHNGDDATESMIDEKKNLISGIGFADNSAITSMAIIGKGAINFLEFLSATKITTTKIGTTGSLTLLNPHDGLVIARGRFIIENSDKVSISLPLGTTTTTSSSEYNQIINIIKTIARSSKFPIAVSDNSEQLATLRLIGRGVGVFISQFLDKNFLEKSLEQLLGKDFTLPHSFNNEQNKKLDQMARQFLIKHCPLHQAKQINWQGFYLLLSRRRFLPNYYIGGSIGDIEITCASHQAAALYQTLWKMVADDNTTDELFDKKTTTTSGKKIISIPTIATILNAMNSRAFGLGQGTMDYWRLLKGEGNHHTGSEIDGTHGLYDLRLDENISKKKFNGRDEAMKDALWQKNRQRLCGFVATLRGRDALEFGHHRGIIRSGSIVQEIDKEPLAQGHGIGHITTATYCPLQKKYIALGYVAPKLDELSGKWKDPFGMDVMIADPLFKNYQIATIVPYNQLSLPTKEE
ncbi:MAG: 2Fe-2S iron-sulfur cluster-binding protein [Alphaproteobacteria bacterium]